MDLTEVVARRRMVRRYRDTPVDPRAIERIVTLACAGPSAGFSQGQSFVVLTDDGTRRRIAEIAGEAAYVAKGFDAWLSTAPVHVVPCVSREAYVERYAEPDKASSVAPGEWDIPYWWVDGGAAFMLLLLGAVDEGLAAGFLAVDVRALRELLGIPEHVAPLGVVTIGHPEADRRSGSLARGWRPREEMIRWERW